MKLMLLPLSPSPSLSSTVVSKLLALTLISLQSKDVSAFSLTECLTDEAMDPFQCPHAFDGECDVPKNCPEASDCFDCSTDPCKQYSYDCSACIENECYWCAGDGLCSSETITQDMLNPFTKETECIFDVDWQTTCDAWFDSPYDDPLYDSMHWVYEMIDVEAVWKMGYTGKGVHVRVNDDGVDSDHPEFADKYDIDNSCYDYDPVIESDTNKLGDHGTACASLLLAEANNGEGAVGIAHGATISSCIMTGDGFDEREEYERMSHNQSVVHVSSNSWGPFPCYEKEGEEEEGRRRFLRYLTEEDECPFNEEHPLSPCEACTGETGDKDDKECRKKLSKYCSKFYDQDAGCGNYLDWFVECDYAPLPRTAGKALEEGIKEGRDGKGIIYVWAAGNDYTTGADVNGDGYANSRYTISVAAVGKDAMHASYSTPGACNLIAAPGGDDESISNNIVAKPGGGYHDISVGTSFATPTVSGVVALMLEANEDLGWRDVQAILATTASKTDTDDDSWQTNGAEMIHSNKYGFGVVNALDAVKASLEWENLPPEKQILRESGNIDLEIVNDDTDATTVSTLVVERDDVGTFRTESVSVYLDLNHASRGDLKITLASPSGTISVLHPSRRPESSNEVTHWKLTTLANYMEDPVGTWTLEIVDENPRKVSGGRCIDMEFYVPRVKRNRIKGEYTCEWYKKKGWCGDGEVWDDLVDDIVDVNQFNKDYPDGVTGADACCVCGGGKETDEIESLLSWSMIIYGHTGNTD